MMEAAIQDDKRTIAYGRKTIDYSLFFCDRKTMEIAVHPDTTVIVKAPMDSDISLIEKKIYKRARWVFRQLNYFRQFHPKTPDRCYLGGETHLYLGKQYRLKISCGVKSGIKLTGGFFQAVCGGAYQPEDVKKLMNKWYAAKANIQFHESLNRCWPPFSSFGFDKPPIAIKSMGKRWGSLSRKGTITLNTELVKAPKACIDYVMTHELCHTKYRHHGSGFYKLLEGIIPDWPKVKHKLELSLA